MKVHNKATEEFRSPTSLFELDQYKPLSFIDYKVEQYGIAGLVGITIGVLVGAPLAIVGGMGVGATIHRSFWENKKINHENKMQTAIVNKQTKIANSMQSRIEIEIEQMKELHNSKMKTISVGNYILCGIGSAVGAYFLSETTKTWDNVNNSLNYSIASITTGAVCFLSFKGFSKALHKVGLI
ncbi:MAG: hypothetical protein PVI40_07535 [Chlamydiota bacterium]|jgi:hypothetical protein